jgi:hypothetical protein
LLPWDIVITVEEDKKVVVEEDKKPSVWDKI